MNRKFYQRGGFIYFMLFFAPVGIYLMLRYSSWSRRKMLILGLVSGVFFIVCLIATDGSSGIGGGHADSEKVTEVSERIVYEEFVPENYLRESTIDSLGKDKFLGVEYVTDVYYRVIIQGVEGWNDETTREGMWSQGKIFFSEVFADLPEELEGLEVTLEVVFPSSSPDGTVREDVVMKMTLCEGSEEGIVWENVIDDNIPQLMDAYWESPIFNVQ